MLLAKVSNNKPPSPFCHSVREKVNQVIKYHLNSDKLHLMCYDREANKVILFV